jgi:hypothetical protein
MNTETPETDAETMQDEWDHVDTDFGQFEPSTTVPANFARELERERDEARDERDNMQTELEMWRDGNIMHEVHRNELEKVEQERDTLAEALRYATTYPLSESWYKQAIEALATLK